MDPLTAFTPRRPATRQTEPARPEQVRNAAGGYVFALDDAAALRRFLVLGVDGGTYYASPAELTKDNAKLLMRMLAEQPRTVLQVVTDVNLKGAAVRRNATLFALAALLAVPDADVRADAARALPQLVRTGTDLFLLAGYAQQFRGWGRGLRRAFANWYTASEVDALAYQLIKYRQRNGWTHRDVLRKAHPVTADPERAALFDWAVGRTPEVELPRFVQGFMKVQAAAPQDVPALVREYRLPWEALPDSALTLPATWEAILDLGMPMHALIRQLPRLTNLGLLPSFGGRTQDVIARLTAGENLARARVHPATLLIAGRTYGSGRSVRGKSAWVPNQRIVDALDEAFYTAFESWEPSGARQLLALDVSGSMTASIGGMNLSAREAAAAMALVTAAKEPAYEIVGFTAAAEFSDWSSWNRGPVIRRLAISPRQRLTDAAGVVSGLPFGPTDVAAPIMWALEKGLAVDAFVTYTDNETWAGPIHVHEALRRYRDATGIPARLIAVGLTATRYTVGDPTDPGTLNVAGFDPSVPALISEFTKGL